MIYTKYLLKQIYKSKGFEYLICAIVIIIIITGVLGATLFAIDMMRSLVADIGPMLGQNITTTGFSLSTLIMIMLPAPAVWIIIRTMTGGSHYRGYGRMF